MTITTKPVLWIGPDEEQVEEVTVETRLRYVAPDDEAYEQLVYFMHVCPVGHTWQERVTWRPGRGCWSVELLDEQDMQYARWNYTIPDGVLWPLKKKRRKDRSSSGEQPPAPATARKRVGAGAPRQPLASSL